MKRRTNLIPLVEIVGICPALADCVNGSEGVFDTTVCVHYNGQGATAPVIPQPLIQEENECMHHSHPMIGKECILSKCYPK